tara:strand:+ start:254 stop:370 length:117 start_codon:yes stop_codon:yes gene_type:complete
MKTLALGIIGAVCFVVAVVPMLLWASFNVLQWLMEGKC